MKILLNHSFVSISYALAFNLILSTVQAASLPQDIEVDITTKKITSLLEVEKYIEALPYFEQLEAMKVPLPESFYYFKIKSLNKTTDTKKTLTQAQSYFTDYGKNGKYYNEVVEIYSQVSMRNTKEEEVENKLRVKEEAIAKELLMKKESELAEKKRIDDGWRKTDSFWSNFPAYRDGCSAASSLIKRFHSSARNIDCNCSDLAAERGSLSQTKCDLTWQRNSLLEGNKSLHEPYHDMEMKYGAFNVNVKMVRYETMTSYDLLDLPTGDVDIR